MAKDQPPQPSHGLTDASDCLLSADTRLAALHRSCGGVLRGTLAVPELREFVRQVRQTQARLARAFQAFDGVDIVHGYARIRPVGEAAGGGCEIYIDSWQRSPRHEPDPREVTRRHIAIDQACAEITARLDARQHVQWLDASASDARDLALAVEARPRQLWTEYVSMPEVDHRQPAHWQLLDNARCDIPGSNRTWRMRLIPIGFDRQNPNGFELLLIADEPPERSAMDDPVIGTQSRSHLMGSTLASTLSEPIGRIIANADMVRARLAGPLRDEYVEYAENIASAGQHLSGMLDDLVDLEAVETPGFTTAKERVDLTQAVERAIGMLGVPAREHGIVLDHTGGLQGVAALGEFRRVLQILINVLGNAIAYSPQGSTVTIRGVDEADTVVALTISDEGPGIDPAAADRIFEKFERLGQGENSGGGSGLGLYISRRLARVMGGELAFVSPPPGETASGATFKLTLPRA